MAEKLAVPLCILSDSMLPCTVPTTGPLKSGLPAMLMSPDTLPPVCWSLSDTGKDVAPTPAEPVHEPPACAIGPDGVPAVLPVVPAHPVTTSIISSGPANRLSMIGDPPDEMVARRRIRSIRPLSYGSVTGATGNDLCSVVAAER
jgi:hypothetical protein